MEDMLETLLAIEQIKALKARYFRTMDSKDWEGLSDCFTADLYADFRDGPGMLVEGRDAYIAQISEILQDASTIHHGHMPEISVHSETEATGIWAMEDIVELPGMSLQGWGHYHESYRKEQGQWRISSIRLSRLKLNQTSAAK
jgi:hypothetical protein